MGPPTMTLRLGDKEAMVQESLRATGVIPESAEDI